MGLTIHFDIALPGSTPEADALALLQRLQDFAARQEPLTITPLITLTRGDVERDLESNSYEGLLAIFEEVMHTGYNLGADAADPNALALAAFGMTAGEGCDLATFALAAPIPSALAINVDAPVRIHDWHWAGFCKTQYASNVSDEHFVHCHKMIVAILDEAERLGFDVEVHDEGRYWETRSERTLLEAVGEMNHVLAQFAGKLHDALGDEHSLDAEIFKHPEFEHLEMGASKPMVADVAAKRVLSVRQLTQAPSAYSFGVNWHIRQANDMRGNSVARKLGGRKTLGRDVNSDNELIAIVREGLPAEALDHVLAELAEGEIPQASVYRLIGSGRTLQRKRSQDLKLSALESDRLARLARMLVRTEEVFGDAERSRRWLMEPNRALGGQRPLELLDSDTGTVAVDRILVRIDHGVFS